jgi:hypothetical protein
VKGVLEFCSLDLTLTPSFGASTPNPADTAFLGAMDKVKLDLNVFFPTSSSSGSRSNGGSSRKYQNFQAADAGFRGQTKRRGLSATDEGHRARRSAKTADGDRESWGSALSVMRRGRVESRDPTFQVGFIVTLIDSWQVDPHAYM